jgi:hypothetical protein
MRDGGKPCPLTFPYHLFLLLLYRVTKKTILIMTVIDIDETTETGRRILRELATHPEAGKARALEIPCDENGNPIGTPWEEVREELDLMLSEAYGVDFAKVMGLIASGELDEDELTEERLLRPEFKYEPYPGFKPKPSPEYNPDSEWQAAFASEEE